MINLTTQMLKDFRPCYCPTRYLHENWQGTLVDILRMEEIPELDRLWVARRAMNDKGNRLFAVWCAREALKLIPDPDPRSVTACDVAERFANGEATKEELSEARKMASAAAGSATIAVAYAVDAARVGTYAAYAAYCAYYAAKDTADVCDAVGKERQSQINWLIAKYDCLPTCRLLADYT